ncbi:MAG TPA: LuxR C-terminal-related transcriptional regulator, partial [Acidimicrobiales bacterium]|nr:LuxR C-terminal-related transcriptional regulator [Acidimicrobiales bacterium]
VRKRAPLLVAVDDVQWLDEATLDSLRYAARRLHGSARFLLTKRPRSRSDLERVLQPTGIEHVEVAGMSVGAIGRVLSDRSGINLPWRTLRRVHESSQGNPLFALELGRILADGAAQGLAGELPLPELAEDVFRARIEESSESARRILLASALSGGVNELELASLVDHLAIDDAVASGVVTRDGSRIRPAHPMLAAAVRKGASATERHSIHLQLASVATDPILKALHVSVATTGHDPAGAEVATTGAALAVASGRILEAIQLATHAVRLTPPGGDERVARVLALAGFQLRAGQLQQARTFLESELHQLPAGRAKALAHLLLHDTGGDRAARDFRITSALAEAGSEPQVHSLAYAARAGDSIVGWVEGVDEAAAWAQTALEACPPSDAGVADRVKTTLAWARILQGRPIDDLADADGTDGRSLGVPDSIVRIVAVRLAFRGQYEGARELLSGLLARANERGELLFISMIELHLCEVELRAGHVTEAERLVEDLEELLVWEGRDGPLNYATRLRSLIAAVRGDPVDAARLGRAVLAKRSDQIGLGSPGWDRLETLRALGVAALFDRDVDGAIDDLREVWEHTIREHVEDPGAFPVAGELIDALVAGERFDLAGEVIERLTSVAAEQAHPWAAITARRGDALVRLTMADSYLEDAAEALTAVADSYGSLGLDFDRARSLLSLGLVQRRFKKWAAARASLEAAAALFESGGSTGWAGRAREELERVSGRKSSPSDQLTPTEGRVVGLAANGMSNKEIARELFVSVNTIEGHLSRAYAKLGVRSRGQLANALREPTGD